MLQLKNIVKHYSSGDSTVTALNGVSLAFRENEFVSILGKSGCGKTTLLNVIGGLDKYDSGDLIINGKSTKDFLDGDWDVYRNKSIGFVFQSYNLIPHQTVLANVELALTLSGVSREERRKRAVEALEKVGLGNQLKKKPSQMSGGQMQRVAIARALVNNPDILLADEPTGALDSHTSVQIMDLLKEVAKDRLVIMVTHNPDLAQRYSTRIVRLSDGCIIDDTNPYNPDIDVENGATSDAENGTESGVEKSNGESVPSAKSQKKGKKAEKIKKKPMSFPTALSLSLNNLMTKKGRTILTSFAGSIGIIGIALILALSSGIQIYIDRVQEDTLSTYPLTIAKESQNYSAMLSAMTAVKNPEDHSDSDQIFVDDSMDTMISAMSSTVSNNLKDFKAHIDGHYADLRDYVSDIQYTYDFDLNIYSDDGKTQVNPSTIFESMGEHFAGIGTMMEASKMMGSFQVLDEMINNQDLLDQQYEVLAGQWPENWDELVLVVDKNNQISKMTLYMLGVLDQSELEGIVEDLIENGEFDSKEIEPFDYDYFLNKEFHLVPSADFFEKTDRTYSEDGVKYPIWEDMREQDGFSQENFVKEHGKTLKIVGIIRPNKDTPATSIQGTLGYKKELTDMMITLSGESEIISQQNKTPLHNALTGELFERPVYTKENVEELINTLNDKSLTMLLSSMSQQLGGMEVTKEFLINTVIPAMDDAQFEKLLGGIMMLAPKDKANLEKNLKTVGFLDKSYPASINIYAKDFASKDYIEEFIADYNSDASEIDKINYTDLVGIMMSSVSIIINVISYVLIAFVSISLVVSSIMIGIITYISVLERTKEIGILRSIGASKKDISRVFNAETLIVGLSSGLFGILATVLLCLPINLIIHVLTGVKTVSASLPWLGGVILIAISMLLTFIAGLIPSHIAAKKNPVEALRTE